MSVVSIDPSFHTRRAMFELFVGAMLIAMVAGTESAEPDRRKALFDGETLAGWEGDPAFFRIEEGAIVAGTLDEPIPHNAFLCTEQEYSDFELRLRFKLLGKAPNAGVQIRSQRVPNHHEVSGYQADLGQIYWGCLYDESRRNKVLAQPVDRKTLMAVLRKEDWNDYRIRCEGSRIRLWINDLLTVDYTEPDPDIPQSGIIGLQIHGGGPAEAWYKEIVLMDLTKREE